MPPNAKMKLCRTCSEYCHTTCYMVEEAQCAGCVHENPDVMPFVRHSSKVSIGSEYSYLWDCCDEDWYR